MEGERKKQRGRKGKWEGGRGKRPVFKVDIGISNDSFQRFSRIVMVKNGKA